MARYIIDPATGIKTKVTSTDYVPPCLAKTAERKKAFIPEPATETVTATDETTHESTD
jgi:hypothetical protein